MCGEQPITTIVVETAEGSPPRVRGTVYVRLDMLCMFGITPACAGNRCRWEFIAVRMWDHPRVCGEQPGPLFSPTHF